MQKRILALALAISFFHTGFANADQSDCQEAIGRYGHASREISEYARIYGNCVWNSRGLNDCSSEFSSLKDVQDDFEKAISRYRKECRKELGQQRLNRFSLRRRDVRPRLYHCSF